MNADSELAEALATSQVLRATRDPSAANKVLSSYGSTAPPMYWTPRQHWSPAWSPRSSAKNSSALNQR